MRDDSAEILFQSFPQEALVSSSGIGQGCPLFDVVHPALSPTLQGTLKDGFRDSPAACDMLEPCNFPSLESCQKRFLWTHKEADLAPHPVVGLVLLVGDAEKFPQAVHRTVTKVCTAVAAPRCSRLEEKESGFRICRFPTTDLDK